MYLQVPSIMSLSDRRRLSGSRLTPARFIELRLSLVIVIPKWPMGNAALTPPPSAEHTVHEKRRMDRFSPVIPAS
jgi:hypothetical protein